MGEETSVHVFRCFQMFSDSRKIKILMRGQGDRVCLSLNDLSSCFYLLKLIASVNTRAFGSNAGAHAWMNACFVFPACPFPSEHEEVRAAGHMRSCAEL